MSTVSLCKYVSPLAALAVLGLVLSSAAGAATAVQRASGARLVRMASNAEDPIVEYPRIQSFKGDYTYRAFQNRVVLRDNASQTRAVIEVRDQEQAVYPRFTASLKENADVFAHLGPAISEPVSLFNGKLWVQVFLGGTMILEEDSLTIWWGWHKKRSLRVRPSEVTPAPAPAVLPSEVIDLAGALTREEAADLVQAVQALRARTGLAIAFAFLPEMSSEALGKRAAELRQQLMQAQVLPAISGLLAFEGGRSYLWHRDTRLDAVVSWETIQAAWSAAPAEARLGSRSNAFLQVVGGRLSGKPPVVTTNPPVIPQPPVGMGSDADLAPPSRPEIVVNRGALAAEVTVTPNAAAELKTADGLTLRFSAGGVKAPLSVRIFNARPTAPNVQIRGIGEAQAVPMTTLCGWDVDLGGYKGLLPKPVDVTIDLARFQRSDGKVPALAPAETLDGKVWSFLPYTVQGTKLTFQTRHFTPKILGAHPGLWVTLGILSAGYVIYYRADELPSICSPDAPFVSSGAPNLNGFEICWSVKMPGVDPKAGLRDEAGFKKAIEDRERGGFVIQDKERNELRREYLMPEAARRIEDALNFAQAYLVGRGFSKPYLSVPIYITPSLKEDEGLLYNPWTGRRYILISGNLDVRGTYRATLHEVFHHFQVGYNWISDGDTSFLEACATLMEREAGRDPIYQKKLAEVAKDASGLLNPVDNNAKMDVYRTGLAGPGYSRDPKPAQRHGYGLSWFLEYLRDKKNPTNKNQFMLDLMSNCSSYSATDALKWAAGNSAFYLSEHYRDFAEEMVLNGITTQNPYGKLYFPSSPYQVWEEGYRKVDIFDFAATATYELGGKIPAWSIQTYRLTPPPGKKAKLLVQVPEEWFATGSRRGAFLRVSAKDVDVKDYRLLIQPGDTAVALPFDGERGFYAADTGQTVKPARLCVLEPPTAVNQQASGPKLRVSWKIPAAVQTWPDLFKGYRVYVTATGESKPAAVVDVPRPVDDFNKNPVEIDPVALKITPEQQKKGLQVQVTTVTREGLVAQTSPAGGKEPLESERSEATTAPAGGTLSVLVHEPKPDKLPNNPFEVLGGTPTPGASVTCRYTWQGKNVSFTAVTDKNGNCRFTAVPFGVVVTIEIQSGLRKESKTITLMPQQPNAGVQFGWMGHEVRPSGGVSIPPNVPAPKPK